tara:strand:+ start:21000 stop:21179 length:180 start_codon:yes stop_codon:yes gene_type:complete
MYDEFNDLSPDQLSNLTLILLDLLQKDNGSLLVGEDLRQFTALISHLVIRNNGLLKKVS